MNYSGKTILISGGSRGIGLSIAELYASKGANITIIARDEIRIEKALHQIRSRCLETKQQVFGLKLDVTQDTAVKNVIGDWITRNGSPDILINSAGFAQPGHIEELPLEIFRKTMDVNYFGTVNITKAVLPSMLNNGRGKIANISSIGGFLGIYGYTAYSGSKYAVTGFSDALRNEMKPRGIQVSIVFPPDTDTEQLAYESQFKPEVTRVMAGTAGLLTPMKVAKIIVDGIEKGKYIINPGFEAGFIYMLHHLAGKLTFTILDWMSVNAWKKQNKKTN
jgi:3-dehydrosphinganine reductase